MLDTTIQVRTDHFDGPLGLLLLLIEKEEMDIRALDLARITKQYLDYLANMQELNFDVAGEYLYLAATLLLLKSKSCITDDELSKLREGGDGDGLAITSHAELIRRLEELQHSQKMGLRLWELPRKGEQIFVRPRIDRKAIIDSILTPMDLQNLIGSMVGLIQKEKRKYTVIRRDRLSIKEKLEFLKESLKLGERTDLDTLLDQHGGRGIENVVITFISVLELSRLKRLSVFQNEDFSAIYIDVIQALDDFDVNAANGFDDPNQTEIPGAAPVEPPPAPTETKSELLQ